LELDGTHGHVEIKYDNAVARRPSNRKVGKLDYDSSQLRTTKTTSWEAVDRELAKHTPDHLPTPWWKKEEPALKQKWAAKNPIYRAPKVVLGYYFDMKARGRSMTMDDYRS
jgi:hypothetical protein